MVKYRCFRCYNHYGEDGYYLSSNGITNRLTLCKDCCQEIFANLVDECGNPYDALYKFCSIVNIVYDKKVAEGIVAKGLEKDATYNNILNLYLTTLKFPQYKGKTFLDSDVLKSNLDEDPTTQALITASKANINKWGAGYSKEEYIRLSELYSQWANGTPQDTVTQVSLTKDLCKIDLKIEQAAVKGLDTKDLLKQKQDLIKSLAIDPQTLLKNRKDNEATECFGAWIAEIEKTSPAEYLDDPSVYFDVNGIEDYWEKHIRRPLRNLLLGTKDFPDITK